MMMAAPHPGFRQKFCKAEGCGARFFICSHCDQGQSYCSYECRLRTRLEQHRPANRRHQQSPEGRADHRDRQRAYRRRKAAASLAPPPHHQQPSPVEPFSHHDRQPSAPGLTLKRDGSIFDRDATSAMLLLPRSQWPIEPVREPLRGFRVIVCRFCGRIGLFLNPYAEPG